MLNLNHLRVFYEAAKYESFTVAAKKLFITQPAVTKQIRAFESDCNLVLFKKRGRKVYLTDEGKALFHSTRKIFESEKEVESAIEELMELKRGILRLGCPKTYTRYFMPLMISAFHKKYFNIKLDLKEGSSMNLTQRLLNFEIEVAITAMEEDNPRLRFTPFSREELLLLLTPHHPLAKKKALSIGELVGEPIIMREKGSETRKAVEKLFARYKLTPDILMETSNYDLIKQLVQQGEGISFLVRAAVDAELQEKKITTVPLKVPKIFLEVNIAYLKNQKLSNPARSFVDMLESLGSEMKQNNLSSLISVLSESHVENRYDVAFEA